MTKIVLPVVIYEAISYELLSPASLIKPRDLGLFTGRHRPTHNPGGFLCTYQITDDRLFLESLSCPLVQPRGWLKKIIYSIRKYPPVINRVKPVASEYGELIYDGLSRPLKYTGKLILGATGSGWIDEIDVDDPGSYFELLTLSFDDGKLSPAIERKRGKLELRKPPSLRKKS